MSIENAIDPVVEQINQLKKLQAAARARVEASVDYKVMTRLGELVQELEGVVDAPGAKPASEPLQPPGTPGQAASSSTEAASDVPTTKPDQAIAPVVAPQISERAAEPLVPSKPVKPTTIADALSAMNRHSDASIDEKSAAGGKPAEPRETKAEGDTEIDRWSRELQTGEVSNTQKYGRRIDDDDGAGSGSGSAASDNAAHRVVVR